MSETSAPAEELLADVEEAMRDVVDPELGINVVDLGLVYGLDVQDGDEGTVALIDMTLTSAACPLTDVIEDQSRSALVGSGLVDDIRINWVWNPPWGPDKITEDGREQLRALGFRLNRRVAERELRAENPAKYRREFTFGGRCERNPPQKASSGTRMMSSSMFSMTLRTPVSFGSMFFAKNAATAILPR